VDRDAMNQYAPPPTNTNEDHLSGFQHQKLLPLRLPFPIRVRTNDEGFPAELERRGKRSCVVAIRERWKIDDEWWRDRISREYFALVLDNGQLIILFRDLVDNEWYGQ
ncbi:uncharacterized protein METZ01_LOCUS322845, partial [marine metagenome]